MPPSFYSVWKGPMNTMTINKPAKWTALCSFQGAASHSLVNPPPASEGQYSPLTVRRQVQRGGAIYLRSHSS